MFSKFLSNLYHKNRKMKGIFIKPLFANTNTEWVFIQQKVLKTLNLRSKMLYLPILGLCYGLNFQKQLLCFKSTLTNLSKYKLLCKKSLKHIFRYFGVAITEHFCHIQNQHFRIFQNAEFCSKRIFNFFVALLALQYFIILVSLTPIKWRK